MIVYANPVVSACLYFTYNPDPLDGLLAVRRGGLPMVNAGAEGKAPPTPRRKSRRVELTLPMMSPHGATPSPWGCPYVALDSISQLIGMQLPALRALAFSLPSLPVSRSPCPGRNSRPLLSNPQGGNPGIKKPFTKIGYLRFFLPGHHSRYPPLLQGGFTGSPQTNRVHSYEYPPLVKGSSKQRSRL